MIFNKKRSSSEKKLIEYIGKPKNLWKALEYFGLPNKLFSCKVSAFKVNIKVEHDVNSILEDFKN